MTIDPNTHSGDRRLTVPATLVRLNAFLESRSRAVLWCLALGGLAFVAVADVATGPELAWSIFYLAPVALAAWHLGWRPALGVVFTAGFVWLAADRLSGRVYGVPVAQYWNALVRTSLFFILAYTMTLLKQGLEHERELARTDPLTGAPNWRSFLELAEHELARARRVESPLTAVYLDVDRFKEINDTRGHAAGDLLLRQIADVLRTSVRDVDLVARLGGDEFAVLLPDLDADGAQRVVPRILDGLHALARDHDWPVGFSTGVVTFQSLPYDVEHLIRLADNAMYSAKRDGGDSACYRINDTG